MELGTEEQELSILILGFLGICPMLRRIEIRGLRALHCVRVDLNGFQLLVGPNASGKSTFFDAVHFVRDILNVGLERAIHGDAASGVPHRAEDPVDLSWMGQGESLEIALSASLPALLDNDFEYTHCRYEVSIGLSDLTLRNETFWLCKELPSLSRTADESLLFPMPVDSDEPIIVSPRKKSPAGWRKVVSKIAEGGNDYFQSETTKWNNMFRLGPGKSALANLPEDEERFPVAVWFKRFLMEDICRLALNAESMRLASPPGGPKGFLPDGSNLPWVIWELEQHAPERLAEWIEHLQTALPDLEGVSTREREDNRSRYVVLRYKTGLEAPSWVVSDGTLRLLALTLLAYMRKQPGLLLIEEPENGIHPRAVETVFQSLSSIYDSQVLCATHSPVTLSLAEPRQILCFGKDVSGAVDIVNGAEHPKLRDWQGNINLGDLFAAGVLS